MIKYYIYMYIHIHTWISVIRIWVIWGAPLRYDASLWVVLPLDQLGKPRWELLPHYCQAGTATTCVAGGLIKHREATWFWLGLVLLELCNVYMYMYVYVYVYVCIYLHVYICISWYTTIAHMVHLISYHVYPCHAQMARVFSQVAQPPNQFQASSRCCSLGLVVKLRKIQQ